jgi:predicted dehydrogenase
MRLIQVGVGGFGETWLGRIQSDHTASLVGLVDTNPQALEVARETTGLSGTRCFEDYEAAMDAVEADAVLNVTPPAVHHGVALAAFERGLHVLTEKPIADTMEHGRLMVAAAREAGRTLMVSQNYRFRPWARTMRQLLQSGQFGPPDNISVRFAKALKLDRDSELTIRHQLVRDMSIHHFDLMRAITGREPLTVCAKAWQPQWSWFKHDPCVLAFFEFEGGLKVAYDGTWVTRGRETLWDGYWRVECPEGVIELRGDRVHIISADMPGQDTEVELQREPSSGQTAALQEFQKAVEERREPETSGRDNLKSLAMCSATVESSRIGAPVNVADMIEQA